MRLDQGVEHVQRTLIEAALDSADGIKTQAAKKLGMNERRLSYLMNTLGI